MKDSGLGTPATRAAIIETLLKRAYVVREGKHLVPTPMGMGLLDALPVPTLASPELTGNWEARLARIARGQETRPAFMGDIARYVKEAVDAIRAAAPMADVPVLEQKPPAGRKRGGRATRPAGGKPARQSRSVKSAAKFRVDGAPSSSTPASTQPAVVSPSGIADLRCPVCSQGQIITGKRGWGCSRWREGCKFVVWFEENGQRRSEADLRAIVAGK